MPFNPTANDIWNPDQWKNPDVAKPIDNARHYGVLSQTQMLPQWQGQLQDLTGGIEAQRNARSQANTLLTPQGRESQVRSFGSNAQQQAYQMGKKMAAQLAQRGIQGQEAATQLGASNQAARATNDYRANMNSPQGLAQLYQMLMSLNDPEAIMSLNRLFESWNSQDFPRQQAHEQQAAAEASQSGFGGMLGQLIGLATQASVPGVGGALGGAAVRLLGDASSQGVGQSQVTRR